MSARDAAEKAIGHMTNYTVTEEGIYFDAPLEPYGHVDVRWESGSRGVQLRPDADPHGSAWIGRDFMPWSAFGVPDGARIEWAQYSGSEDYYGEPSYPATGVRAEYVPGGVSHLWIAAEPAGSRRIVCV